MDLTKLYARQISMTEWLQQIGHPKAETFRLEDNEKRERLRVLHGLIGLPYDRPHGFPAKSLAARTPDLERFLDHCGEQLCALRLVPLKKGVPKYRMRGHTINKAMDWFDTLDIDPGQYRVEFVPHSATDRWATIFVVNSHGISGEIVKGGHHQLTQGYHKHEPINFMYDFTAWNLAPHDDEALQHLKEIVAHLKVSKPSMRKRLQREFGAGFTKNYLHGYFETTLSDEHGLFFIDYNRLLGQLFNDFVVRESYAPAYMRGKCASPGRHEGKVRIVADPKNAKIDKGDILVCEMTNPDYLHLMQRAGGIITAQGGLLTHAAIVSRELSKPCIVGVQDAMTLKDGETIIMDAQAGTILKE